jgi:hypothetical protein
MKVNTLTQLNELIDSGKHDFYILLKGGLRSSKFIEYNDKTKKYYVFNEIDGSDEYFTETELFNQKLTNIGYALYKGSLYAYD